MRAKEVYLPPLLSQVKWEELAIKAERVAAELKGCEEQDPPLPQPRAARASGRQEDTPGAAFCT